MAKLKDEFDFENDDFGFEDFGGDSFGGFQDNEKAQKRRPFKKLAGAFVGGVKDSFLSRDTHREMIKGSLPAGYSYMYDAADSTATSVKGLYDTARSGAGDVTKEIKRGLPGVIPGLPISGGMKDKLKRWSATGANAKYQDVNMEEAELAIGMGEVFGNMSKGGAEVSPSYGSDRQGPSAMEATAAGAAILSDIADKIQGNSNIALLQGIKLGIDRLTNYQDQVTISYQKKSLELQFRQYAVARKSLDVLMQNLELSRVSYDKLIVNTSLPDIVKMENSELAHQMLKQKFLGSVIENVGGRFGNVGSRIVTKAKTQLKGFFRDIGASVQEGMFTGSQLAEGMGEEGGMDKTSFAGNIAGGMAGKLLSKKLAKMIKEKTKDNPKIAALGLSGANFLSSGGDIMQQLIKDDTGNGLLEMLKWTGFFDEFGFTRNDTLRTDATMHMDKVAQWDQRSKVSLEEVIPGYLRSIDAHVRAIQTGGEVDPMEYSYKTGKFEKSSAVKAGIFKALAGDDKMRGTALALNSLVKKVGGDKGLSDGAQRALKAYIFDQKKDGRNPDFAGLSDGSVVLSSDAAINMEIEQAVTENMLGGAKYTGDSNDVFAKLNHTFRRDVTQQSRMKDYLDEARNLENEIGGMNNADYLQQVRNGSTQHLVDLGLAEYDKDGSTLRRKFDVFRDGAINLGAGLPDPDDVQGPPKPPVGPDGKPIKPKTKAQQELEEKAKEKAKAKKEAAEQSKVSKAIKDAAEQAAQAAHDLANSDTVQGAKSRLGRGAKRIKDKISNTQIGDRTIGDRVSDAAASVDRTVFNGGEQHHTGGIVGSKGAKHRDVMMGAFNGAHKYHTGGVAGKVPDLLVVEGRKPGTFYTTAPNGKVVEWTDQSLIGKRKVTAEDIEAAKARIAKKHAAKYVKSYKDRSAPGLKPNEVPAVLEKGEEVLTAHDPRHRNNMGKRLGFKKENEKGILESIYMSTQTMVELLTVLAEKDLSGWMPSADLSKWKSKIRGGYDSVKGFVPAGLKDARAKLGKGYDVTMNQVKLRRTQLMTKMKGVDWDGMQAAAAMGYDYVKDGGKRLLGATKTKGGALLGKGFENGKDILGIAKIAGASAWHLGIPKLKAGLASAKEHGGGLMGYMKMRAHLTKNAIKDKLTASGVRDIVVAGSSRTLLTKAQLESGELIDNQTGNVVHALEDITGMVVDKSGKEVVSPDDFNKGLRYASKADSVKHNVSSKFTSVRDKIKARMNNGQGITGKLGGLKASITGKVGGIRSKAMGFLKGFLKTGSFSQAVVSAEASTITDELSGIKAIFGAVSKIGILLETRMPADKKKPFWDRDGDGTRDGSEKKKGLFERIKDKLRGNGGADDKEKDKKDKKEGGGLVTSLFGNKLLLGAAGSAIGAYLMNKFVGDGEASVGKTAAGAVAGGVGALMAGKMLWNGTKWVAKGAGKLAWGATKMAGRGVMGLGRFALMRAAPALGGMAMSALGGMASAAAAVITAPVALIALAAAVVIGGGYLIYKHYKNKKNPVARLRMAQYGFNLNDEKHGKAICDLETDLLKNVRVSKTGPASIGAGRKAEEYFKMFGVDPAKPDQVTKWLQWYQYRFKPVFLSHVTTLYRTTGKKDLAKADDLMGRSEKVKYLGDVHYKNGAKSPYTVMVSPFGDEDKVKFDLGDVNSAYKTAVSNAEDEKEKPKSKPDAKSASDKVATKPKVVTKTPTQLKADAERDALKAEAKKPYQKNSGHGVWESLKLFAAGGLDPALKNMAKDEAGMRMANKISNSFIGKAISSVWSGSDHFTQGGKASDHEARLIKAAVKYGITDPVEIEMFLAQCAHESGNFKFLRELGKDSYFAKYDGRKDLGNTQAGDGAKFKGRGYIQVTGRHNYTAFAQGTGIDVVNNPGMIDNNPDLAAEISAYWWTKVARKAIRSTAAAGDVVGTTKIVNGGTNGLSERQKYFAMYSAKFGKKGPAEMLTATGAPNAAKDAKALSTAQTPATKPGASARPAAAATAAVAGGSKVPTPAPIKPGSGPISAVAKTNASTTPTTTPSTGSAAGATSTAGYATGGKVGSGGGKVNLDAMCSWASNNAGGASKGICATHVRKALEAGGASTKGHPVSAKDYGATLTGNGFQALGRDGYVPQKGDVCVFDATPGHPHGHICVFDGMQWVSDFKQRTMNPYKNNPDAPYTVYRHGSSGKTVASKGAVLDKTVKSAAMMDKHSNIVSGKASTPTSSKPVKPSEVSSTSPSVEQQQSVEKINQNAAKNRAAESFSAAASSNIKIQQDQLNIQIRQLATLEKISKTLDGMSKNGGLVNQPQNRNGGAGQPTQAQNDSGNSPSRRPKGIEPDYKAPVSMGLMT